ncbi:MAG: carboxypeptidase regulatory-like domain-containing protein [Acidobacteriaceae bacterium]|nr:carboxypeptidase regulatory-like domain-containing protein [Acidobacteriaceae bacterium]MBV9444087.1 carboxypeptidase regulatory-like domain-containing protein [Acidobacteriaceae bacterium]
MKTRVGLVLLALACSALAQVNMSNLVGAVRDSSGAPVPGVTVKLTNVATGAIRQEVTDDSGLYRASLLEVRTYNLEAEKPGFKKIVKAGIALQVGETTTEDLTLELGGVSQTVTVTGESEQLRTETGSVGSTTCEALASGCGTSRSRKIL